jgi:hypothetical protein
MIIHHILNHSFEIRLDRLTWDMVDPELKPDKVKKKIRERKNWYDVAKI